MICGNISNFFFSFSFCFGFGFLSFLFCFLFFSNLPPTPPLFWTLENFTFKGD